MRPRIRMHGHAACHPGRLRRPISALLNASPADKPAPEVHTDRRGRRQHRCQQRLAVMLAFVVAPSSPTRPHSPSTHAISVAYATLCGVETRRARHCHTRKIHQAGMGSTRRSHTLYHHRHSFLLPFDIIVSNDALSLVVVDSFSSFGGLRDKWYKPHATVSTREIFTDADVINSVAHGTGAGGFFPISFREDTPSVSLGGNANCDLVFSGFGIGPTDRDASIQGDAYLTSREDLCVRQPYYEFNNPGLDAGKPNLKCAVYSDVRTAKEKTDFGGQQLASLYHLDGYELVFGPLDNVNDAPGYMGFAFLYSYDADACAQQCNTRGADGQGRASQFFDIGEPLRMEIRRRIPAAWFCFWCRCSGGYACEGAEDRRWETVQHRLLPCPLIRFSIPRGSRLR
ncbi:hypothetical protein BJ912DRAFT_1147079 [Pholiota molesta]|nr:hypothetical protein BJ912DRAFT_1147079 [Pholiota molesta]